MSISRRYAYHQRRVEAQEGPVRSDRLTLGWDMLHSKIKVFGVFDSVVTNRWYTGEAARLPKDTV
jgi:hypothetical protein